MARLVKSIRSTAADPVEVVFYVDMDDPVSWQTAAELDVVMVSSDPPIVLSDMWNRCANAAQGEVLMQCGDDIVFRTPGWDRAVMAAFEAVPDRIVLVHGDDRLQGFRLATHPFLHRRWVDTVGYLVPPGFSCDWTDVWLHEVAQALGRRVYLPGVVTEHMHPVAGKGPMDQTHRDRMERGARDNVAALYTARVGEREADIAKLRAQMEVPHA